MAIGGMRVRLSRGLLALSLFFVSGSAFKACAQGTESAQAAPDSHSVRQGITPLIVDWARFDRLADVARATPPADRLIDAARALQDNVPAEAGRMRPLDWYCLGNTWCALNVFDGKGKRLTQNTSAMEGDELYKLARKGYRLSPDLAVRVQARLLSLLGIPAEPMTGLTRVRELNRGAWLICQVGENWFRTDLANTLPTGPEKTGEWRPSPAAFQASNDLDAIVAFLKTHLPDGETTARTQGLTKPFSLPDWEQWSKAEARLRDRDQKGEGGLLYVSRVGLLTPHPITEEAAAAEDAPPPPAALSALERLRRKAITPTRGQYLVESALKFVGLPYTWGGESPGTGFDCSGLVKYVCREWGIHLPRTAAEQYHVGNAVRFEDLEPGDFVFLANTYKRGVSHVGIYIGEGKWVQAAGTGIGVIVSDVPYFDAGNGPGARRISFSKLPSIAGEPPSRAVAENTAAARETRPLVVASRHTVKPRKPADGPMTGAIVTIKVCGDTGDLANSGCDTYKVMRVPKSQLKSMHRCYKHRPLSGEH